MKQTLSHQQAQTKTLQRQQAISIMCRYTQEYYIKFDNLQTSPTMLEIEGVKAEIWR